MAAIQTRVYETSNRIFEFFFFLLSSPTWKRNRSRSVVSRFAVNCERSPGSAGQNVRSARIPRVYTAVLVVGDG